MRRPSCKIVTIALVLGAVVLKSEPFSLFVLTLLLFRFLVNFILLVLERNGGLP